MAEGITVGVTIFSPEENREQADRRRIRKEIAIYEVFINYDPKVAAERFALPALGWGRRSRPTGKMLRRGRLFDAKRAAESLASDARFVGRVYFAEAFAFLL